MASFRICRTIFSLLLAGVLVFGSNSGFLIKNARAADCSLDGSVILDQLPKELVDVIVAQGSDGNGGSDDKGVCTAPVTKENKVKSKQKTIQVKKLVPSGGIISISGLHVKDEVLVTVRADGGTVLELAQRYGLTVRSQSVVSLLGGILVRFGIPDGRPVAVVRALLLGERDVLGAEPNHIYHLNGDSSRKTLKRFSLAATEINKARKITQGRGVKVAIIDGAVDEEHPALTGAVRARFDALKGTPVNETDHGTAVALLIGGGDSSFMGAAPEAELYVARAFDKTKEGLALNSAEAILLSLDWAFQQSVDIINMSFAGPDNKYMSAAISALLKSNVVLVAAAGNGGKSAPFAFPAAQDGVFAVTATDAKNRIYAKANRGAYVYVAAPGVDVLVADGNGAVQLRSGTSFGAALFTGICALALEGKQGIDLDKFKKFVELSSTDLGPPGRDSTFGIGLIKAAKLVRLVAQ